VPSSDTEPLSLTVQVKERGREQLASLRTEAAMSGKWAATNYCDRVCVNFAYLLFLSGGNAQQCPLPQC